MFDDIFLTVFLSIMGVMSTIATVGAYCLNKDTKRLKKEYEDRKMLRASQAKQNLLKSSH